MILQMNAFEALIEDDDAVKMIHKEVTIPLLPHTQGNEFKSIQSQLGHWPGRFVASLGGIVIHVKNININSNQKRGRIIDDQPYTFWKAEADFYVINPEPGTVLKGRVQSFSQTKLVLHLYDRVKVYISLEKFRNDENLSDLGPIMIVSSEVCFKIARVGTSSSPDLNGIIDEECLRMMGIELTPTVKREPKENVTEKSTEKTPQETPSKRVKFSDEVLVKEVDVGRVKKEIT